ncbi:MAG: ATP-binding cassette domain-containing protein [Chloroflexi bacterium]|nr:ATP-binding cassette domain-containing protein [Chloroflexota bacterium]
MQTDNKILEVNNLKMYFPVYSRGVFPRHIANVQAVDDISFFVRKGETMGLVGESGCGKTTTGRAIIRLYAPTAGQVIYEGQDVTKIKGKDLRLIRRRIQMVFQDPYSSLNPRMTAGNIVGEPMIVHKLVKGRGEFRDQVRDLFQTVGLNAAMTDRYPHEFSGGQRQRIGVARALAVRPSLIICDEPVSALDVSIQAQILNLLEDLQAQFDLTFIFIAHDLSVVRHMSDRVAVMYLGKIVEIASREELYENPLHPYTKALMSAVPIPDPSVERKRERIVLLGDVPSPLHPPSGCRFHTRCPIAIDICNQVDPEWREVSPNHWVACHRV